MRSKYEELDNFICDVGLPDETAPGISATEGMLFMAGLKKVAQEEVAEAVGPMASIPDEEGELEGPFAASPQQVAQAMAQIIAMLFKQQACYAYYEEILRGPDRGGATNTFCQNSWKSRDAARYFLKRLGALVPGGVQIPPAPMPQPQTDVNAIVKTLIAGEQHLIVLMRQLKELIGENDPMYFTLGKCLGDMQESVDNLWQLVPAKKSGGDSETKMASAIQLAKSRIKNAASDKPMPGPGDVVIPEPGSETPEAYTQRETALALQQAKAEAMAHADRARQLEEVALSSQAEAQNAAAQSELSQQEAASSTEAAQNAQMEAAEARELATMSQENAAQQADAKMRLSMRIQQMRQQLADLVSSDPVQEEGVGFGEEAGPGSPLTESQQMPEEEEMLDEEAATSAVNATPDKAKKETAQAAKAQQEAKQQTQQAAAAQAAAGG